MSVAPKVAKCYPSMPSINDKKKHFTQRNPLSGPAHAGAANGLKNYSEKCGRLAGLHTGQSSPWSAHAVAASGVKKQRGKRDVSARIRTRESALVETAT